MTISIINVLSGIMKTILSICITMDQNLGCHTFFRKKSSVRGSLKTLAFVIIDSLS